jgi:hypothetical protein
MMAEVIEHLSKDVGKSLLDQVKIISRYTLIGIHQWKVMRLSPKSG